MPSAPAGATRACEQPGPPPTIEFSLGGKRLVRYYRKARGADSDAAVLGQGGFGCVYRYALDGSFTPPSSVDLSLSIRRHASVQELVSSSTSSPISQSKRLEDTHPGHPPSQPMLKSPSLVAVKLCRTPCSGSFDELQKTSLVEKKKRRAELQDDRRMHVRIVRGEGRIFEYLQAARRASNQPDDVPLVKLLANLAPSGVDNRDEHHNGPSLSEDEEDGPPTRLLVFEKLIELDAEPTAKGWTKSRKTWSHERVEKVAFEVMQGLKFLHDHNVTHGDLKPSNLMLDPRTGVVKIIDLGASRRFVHLSNRERNNRSAVEQQDRQALLAGRAVTRLAPELCEGLGSLTGSPYYMAPEILIQATRYLDVSGKGHSVLEDYEHDYTSFLPREQWSVYQIGLRDLKRGWGIRADIWSWACTVQALLLKTVDEDQRPSSSTISPYDFSFSRHRHEMIEPLYQKADSEDDVPRFHQWCRVLPLLIVGIALGPVPLVAQADGCSPALRSALKSSLRHQDLRPTADELYEVLRAARSPLPRNSSARSTSADETSLSPRSKEKAGRLSRTPSQSKISELEGSRQTTPTLSQGTSRTSTPQHTSETISRSSSMRMSSRQVKGKVRFDTCGTTEASMNHALTEPTADEREASAVLPHGFELVSPPRYPKARSATLGDAPRPATASARLPSTQTYTWSTNEVQKDAGARQTLRPSSSFRDRNWSRPRTAAVPDCSGGGFLSAERAPRTVASMDLRVESGSVAGARSGRSNGERIGERRPPMSADALAASPSGSALDTAIKGLRGLRLNSPSFGTRRSSGGPNAPHSPTWHLRGASMPALGRDEDGNRAHSALMPARLMRLDGDAIGDSPRCWQGDGKGSRQSSLMATLKETQVRLKFGSKKLKGQRQSMSRSGEEALEDCRMQRGGTAFVTEEGNADWSHSEQAGPGPSSSGRTGSKTGDGKTRSKQLLRRLLTWSASSS